MGDVVLCVESDHPSPCCRICHEEEFESCNSLEAPCACSGTVKFAHRDCVQRWCALKGNTTCELCLQQYEPDYTAPVLYSKSKQQPDSPLTTIRAGLEFPRREEEGESSGSVVTVESGRVIYSSASEFRTAADKLASGCRSVALIFTVLLLMRDSRATITKGTEDYPFTLLTLLLLRCSGIIVPMYLVIRSIAAIQNRVRRHCQVTAYFESKQHSIENNESSSSNEDSEEQHRDLRV